MTTRNGYHAAVQIARCVPVVARERSDLLAETHDLTTVRQPLRDAGAITADLLLSLIDAPHCTPQRVVLRGELVVCAAT